MLDQPVGWQKILRGGIIVVLLRFVIELIPECDDRN
jgi:hypothetical protein